MTETIFIFSSGIVFGMGVVIGGFITWVLVPNGGKMRKENKENNERLYAILCEKNDILKNIADATWHKASIK